MMTDLEFVSMQKSTSVRSRRAPLGVRLMRPGIVALSALSPRIAARLAERMFLTPPRHPAPQPELAALASARQATVRSDDANLTTWTWGDGPAVLLVHGWGGRGGQMFPFVAPLLARGHSVVTFDAPGHGRSPGSRSSLVEFIRAIHAVEGAVGPLQGVIAHSIGAAATACALRDGLDADSAVFVAPPTDLALYATLALDTLGFGRRARDLMRERVETRLGVPWSMLDVPGFAPLMRTPLLVIHDLDDIEVPWQDGAVIAQAWPGARLSVTSGLGHRRVLRDAAVVGEAVGFLRYGFVAGVTAANDWVKNSTTSRRERSASLLSG
jgi:pimeloyl-ACP methyl ester carboxylesterase